MRDTLCQEEKGPHAGDQGGEAWPEKGACQLWTPPLSSSLQNRKVSVYFKKNNSNPGLENWFVGNLNPLCKRKWGTRGTGEPGWD